MLSQQSIYFHLAIACHDFEQAKVFYVDGLGAEIGRENAHAVIMNLGHCQLVLHKAKTAKPDRTAIYPEHFGLIFTDRADWQALVDRVEACQIAFFRAPFLRHEGMMTEHESFFLKDPSNNVIEMKYYKNFEAVFGQADHDMIGGDSL